MRINNRKILNRHPIKLKKIYFKKKKKIFSVKPSIFFKKYKIHCIIQFLSSDFKLIKKNLKRFTHFNAQNTVHKKGRKYLIVKINKPGFFDGKKYKQSILDYKNFILVKCLYSKNYVPYSDIKNHNFKNSLGKIKDIPSLKKTIKRRYKKTLSHLTDNEKISLGIAVTDLKIIKRF